MNTLLLVDGNALMHRAYHAIPQFRTKNGIPTNAVYGFVTILLKTREYLQTTHLIVCFDRPEPTFRKKIFIEYQSHRPKVEPMLSDQFPMVKDFLDAAGVAHIEKAGFEADDIIGTISRIADKKKFKTIILTGDKDIMQLITDNTVVATPHKGLADLKIYDEKEAEVRLGVTPRQIPDLKGLMGDPSDNYKGVMGIGPKTAASLISRYKTLENVYKNIESIENVKTKELLLRDKENAYLSKKLATIVCDVAVAFNIESSAFTNYNEKLKDFFLKMEFDSFLKKYFGVEKNIQATKKEDKKKIHTNQLGLF